MPHRNNMSVHRSRSKLFLLRAVTIVGGVAILQQPIGAKMSTRWDNCFENSGLCRTGVVDGLAS